MEVGQIRKKVVLLLLLCMATLSIVSVYEGAALSFLATQPRDASSTVLAKVAQNAFQNAKQPALHLIPLGDPVDDPVPHTQ